MSDNQRSRAITQGAERTPNRAMLRAVGFGDNDFDKAGAMLNPKLENRLKMMSRDLVVYGGLLRDQYQSDLAATDPDTFAARYRTKQ